MQRRISESMAHNRLASWFRKDYPKTAHTRGHCSLLALFGVEHAPR